ncbi:TlpA family protein disulfide reductase [Pedobacter sp. GR22-6]|uniref:TlpA family protein disulfide reductase n=1 Tax=Pedobacter sp. GR22-6 TaxID=3127957 RepID=UPI00307DFFFC
MKNLTILALLVTYSLVAKSKNFKNSDPDTGPRYYIDIIGTIGDQAVSPFTEIQISAHSIYSSINLLTGKKEGSVKIDQRNFRIRQEIPSEISYITFEYSIQGRSYGPVYLPTNFFKVSSRQKIHCSFFRDSLVFSGRDAEVFNLQTKLFLAGSINKINIGYDDPNYLNEIKKMVDLNFQEQSAVLLSHTGKVNESWRDYFFNYCLGTKKNRMISAVLSGIKSNNYSIAKEFYQYLIHDDQHEYPEELHTSALLMDYLYKMEKFKFEYLKTTINTINKNGAADFFRMIRRKYNGKIRAHITVLALVDLPKTYVDTYDEAHKAPMVKKESPYFSILSNLLQNNSPKKLAYQFELTDSSGREFKMRDFQGKVVVLDFWFVGCIPCKLLSKEMGPIIDSFKKRNVAFITINVDQNKISWIKALKSLEYSHVGSVDLNTGDLGVRHPIIAHYNVTTYPRLIVVDKMGNLISAEPTRPISSNPESATALIKLIQANL